jgi:arginyl-tRNA synthetase
VITGDVRRAIARAIAAEGLPPADPGLRPTGVPGQCASSVAFAFGERRAEVAARIAAQLSQTDGIARAELTGPGFITITIAPDELAAQAERIVVAGPACATSDALQGVTVPAPPAADPLAKASWEEARAALALQVTARLAAAAGATVAPQENMERTVSSPGPRTVTIPENIERTVSSPGPETVTIPENMERIVSSPDPEQFGVGREATVRYSASLAEPAASPPPQETELARAVAFAGADAVRFALARAAPGRPVVIEGPIVARHVLGNPAYAVRYAHARAASGVRWAATSLAVPLGRRAVLRHLPADPGELVLLDALSWLPERVAAAARRGRPDEFARYLEELASATIAALIGAGDPGTARVPSGRLALAEAAQTGLAAGLGLLGVDAPDRL